LFFKYYPIYFIIIAISRALFSLYSVLKTKKVAVRLVVFAISRF